MRSEGQRPRVVAIGGGHGLSRTLRALTMLDVDTTAVVSVADDGGSSGRLRRDYGVMPPGDLRMALACMVEPDVARALQHRWRGGELDGHAMGNLLVTALAATRGEGMTDAFLRAGELLGACGRVLACATAPLTLVGVARDGSEVRGQVAIATSSGHRSVRVEPADVAAEPLAVEAIMGADLVVLGPGSVFTSILPNLAVRGIADAVRATPGRIVHIANMRQQPMETLGLDLAAHLDVLWQDVGERRIDVVVQHDGRKPIAHGPPLEPLDTHPAVGRFVTADLLDGKDGHDPEALAAVLGAILTA